VSGLAGLPAMSLRGAVALMLIFSPRAPPGPTVGDVSPKELPDEQGAAQAASSLSCTTAGNP
jgi:hypothetical protein